MKRAHRVAAAAAATTMAVTLALTGAAAANADITPRGGVTSCTTQYSAAVQQAGDVYNKAKKAAETKYAQAKVDAKAVVDSKTAAMRANIDLLEKKLDDNKKTSATPGFYDRQDAILKELGDAWTTLKTETPKLKAEQKATVAAAQKVRKAELAAARSDRATSIEQARTARSACKRG